MNNFYFKILSNFLGSLHFARGDFLLRQPHIEAELCFVYGVLNGMGEGSGDGIAGAVRGQRQRISYQPIQREGVFSPFIQLLNQNGAAGQAGKRETQPHFFGGKPLMPLGSPSHRQ